MADLMEGSISASKKNRKETLFESMTRIISEFFTDRKPIEEFAPSEFEADSKTINMQDAFDHILSFANTPVWSRSLEDHARIKPLIYELATFASSLQYTQPESYRLYIKAKHAIARLSQLEPYYLYLQELHFIKTLSGHPRSEFNRLHEKLFDARGDFLDKDTVAAEPVIFESLNLEYPPELRAKLYDDPAIYSTPAANDSLELTSDLLITDEKISVLALDLDDILLSQMTAEQKIQALTKLSQKTQELNQPFTDIYCITDQSHGLKQFQQFMNLLSTQDAKHWLPLSQAVRIVENNSKGIDAITLPSILDNHPDFKNDGIGSYYRKQGSKIEKIFQDCIASKLIIDLKGAFEHNPQLNNPEKFIFIDENKNATVNKLYLSAITLSIFSELEGNINIANIPQDNMDWYSLLEKYGAILDSHEKLINQRLSFYKQELQQQSTVAESTPFSLQKHRLSRQVGELKDLIDADINYLEKLLVAQSKLKSLINLLSHLCQETQHLMTMNISFADLDKSQQLQNAADYISSNIQDNSKAELHFCSNDPAAYLKVNSNHLPEDIVKVSFSEALTSQDMKQCVDEIHDKLNRLVNDDKEKITSVRKLIADFYRAPEHDIKMLFKNIIHQIKFSSLLHLPIIKQGRSLINRMINHLHQTHPHRLKWSFVHARSMVINNKPVMDTVDHQPMPIQAKAQNDDVEQIAEKTSEIIMEQAEPTINEQPDYNVYFHQIVTINLAISHIKTYDPDAFLAERKSIEALSLEIQSAKYPDNIQSQLLTRLSDLESYFQQHELTKKVEQRLTHAQHFHDRGDPANARAILLNLQDYIQNAKAPIATRSELAERVKDFDFEAIHRVAKPAMENNNGPQPATVEINA